MDKKLESIIMNSQVGCSFIKPIIEAYKIIGCEMIEEEFISAIDEVMNIEMDYSCTYVSNTLYDKKIVYTFCYNNNHQIYDSDIAIMLSRAWCDEDEIRDVIDDDCCNFVCWLLDNFSLDVFEDMELHGELSSWIEQNKYELPMLGAFDDLEEELIEIFVESRDESETVSKLNELLSNCE